MRESVVCPDYCILDAFVWIYIRVKHGVQQPMDREISPFAESLHQMGQHVLKNYPIIRKSLAPDERVKVREVAAYDRLGGIAWRGEESQKSYKSTQSQCELLSWLCMLEIPDQSLI